MHSIWFRLALNRDSSVDEVMDRLQSNPRVAMTDKQQANVVCGDALEADLPHPVPGGTLRATPPAPRPEIEVEAVVRDDD